MRDVFHEDFGYGALRLLADASDVEARDLVAECEGSVARIRDALRALSLAVGDEAGARCTGGTGSLPALARAPGRARGHEAGGRRGEGVRGPHAHGLERLGPALAGES